MKVIVINGPNLNLLGTREVEIYGEKTYHDLVNYLKQKAKDLNIRLKIYQTNSEGRIIDYLQKASKCKYDAIILNAGAYTHYSYAIMDAIKAIKTKVYEVHLTDINKRDNFRHISVIKDVCTKSFMGKHFDSYYDALKDIVNLDK